MFMGVKLPYWHSYTTGLYLLKTVHTTLGLLLFYLSVYVYVGGMIE